MKSPKTKNIKSERKPGRFSQLRDFVLDHLETSWKIRSLCIDILGAFNLVNEKKLKGYFSRLRSYLLGKPQQLVLPIKKKGLIEAYRVATPDDTHENEKLLGSYSRRALSAMERAHRALEVAQIRGLVPDQTIDRFRAGLPPQAQMKLPYS
jgi:hypothetical protein